MANNQDEDMYLFQGDLDQTPSAFAGPSFDNFLDTSPAAQNDASLSNDFLDPTNLAIKKEDTHSPRENPAFGRSSTSSASSSSSSTSIPQHNRNISSTTTASPSNVKQTPWNTGINGMSMPASEQFYDDSTMSGFDQDFEASDQQMASAFDFDTAASTPSGFDSATMNGSRSVAASQPLRRTTNMAAISQARNPSPRMTAAPAQFFIGSREASPLSTMLPANQAPSPWNKHSPSSGLEETFNHMGMNGDSPGNATFSPNMNMSFSGNPFSFDPDSSATPSSFAKDISSPPSTINSVDGAPTLHIYPTSLKSRVETQIPIRMTLLPLPAGVKKLRLPTHTVSKPKFLAKPEVDKSPEILELHTSLVCTSAMQDPVRKQRALARARGDDLSQYAKPSPASSSGSTSSKDDDEKPLNGGEVRICSGCIQRERKRASRKKQKKPEEEELFQKDEEKRVVVFNTNELKDWVEVTRENQPTPDQGPIPPPGAMQVELPMRIACYCRHQNEKMGFMVIFTIKDFREKVIAQAMTNSIMITDDHKTHNAPAPMSSGQPNQVATATHFPGAGVFQTGGMELPMGDGSGAKLFKQSYSTPDLTRLQHHFNPQFAASANGNPFAIPSAMSANTSATMTPRNLSRPASPTGPTGPATKRRKPSGSGKLPTGLTMTRLDTSHAQSTGPATMPNTAASSPFAPSMPSFMGSTDRNFQPPGARGPAFGNSPPTPNGNDGSFNPAINRSFSLENIPRQALLSAPSSRQPSRPGSPVLGSARNSFGQGDPNFTQAVNNQLLSGQPSRRPIPVIHKLVPAEGSTSGGTEVTLLGNGFYQGLEVMFGDTEATTTTFWGEKCLNCIAPPAVQPGMVAVVFKHEHPHYSTMQSQAHSRPSVFTYVDDREIEMLRLALRTIGKQMGTEDPYTAAQQVLQQNQPPGGGMYPQTGTYGMGGGHQRNVSAFGNGPFEPTELDFCLLRMLHLAKISIERGPVDLSLCRPTGLTLLHFAASLGLVRFGVALLASGADPNSLDRNGHTPLHHAAMNGHEMMIYRLRLAGADHRVKSIRNFCPADLATTLLAYQAIMRPYQHYQARSLVKGSTYPHNRSESSRSLKAFWDDASVHYSESDSDLDDEEENTTSIDPERPLPFIHPGPLYVTRSHPPSRRGSRQLDIHKSEALTNRTHQPDQPESPSALASAWRQIMNMTQFQQQQLAEQFQQLQENAQWAMPNLPNIPLPDYQTYPVVRRVSSLFPQRPTGPGETSQKEGWWDSFKRTSSPTSPAPPSYEELYPGSAGDPDATDLKKSSALRAAADAAADQHFEMQASKIPSAPTEGQASSGSQIRKVELREDRKLFFFWIPLLAIVLALMFKNSAVWEIVPAVVDRITMPGRERVVETA